MTEECKLKPFLLSTIDHHIRANFIQLVTQSVKLELV